MIPHAFDALAVAIVSAAFLYCGWALHRLHRKLEGADPWQMQRALMEISPGQEIPDQPTVTRTSLLYFALMLEEIGELAEALHRAFLDDHGSFGKDPIYGEAKDKAFHVILVTFISNAKLAHQLRQALRDLPVGSLAIPLYSDQIGKDILDGTNDVAVVNCGFSVATGLPGAKAFANVNASNRSKADPVSGRIESDASGKWIKGPKYFPPSLEAFLPTSPAEADACWGHQ